MVPAGNLLSPTIITCPKSWLHAAVPALLGIILLVAGGLKAYQLSTDGAIENSLLGSPWVLAGLLQAEVFLAVWLLSGLYIRAARIAALVCYSVFLGMTLHRALSGESSCGCFGDLTVNPWVTALFDTIAIASLWFWRPGSISMPGGMSREPRGTLAQYFALVTLASISTELN